ncbi:MAG: hypothetical protein ACRDYE_12200, partial [Acidimicrobiales bacterium]
EPFQMVRAMPPALPTSGRADHSLLGHLGFTAETRPIPPYPQWLSHLAVTLVGMAELHPLRPAPPDDGRARFAAVALTGLAALGPRGKGGPDLALQLGLSAWMRLARVGTGEARDALSVVREAVVAAAGLDPTCEPVPLTGRDPGQDTLLLAGYLCDLVDRAARMGGSDRAAVVARALPRLSAGADRISGPAG